VGRKTVTGNTDRWTLKFRKPWRRMPDMTGSGFELAEILETLSGNCPAPP